MNSSITSPLLSQLSGLVEARMGLHFPEERWCDLERKLSALAHEFEFPDAGAFADWLVSSPLTDDQFKLLVSNLTVGETYFFRDKRTWEALRTHVLPELIASRWGKDQRLRLWSTACCTGEEPYSLAMVLDELLPQQKTWNNTILATDINSRFLQRAAQGTYSQWSFRGVPEDVRSRYFRKNENGDTAILPSIIQQVNFAELNLAEDAYPSLTTNTNAMDVIMCRNILIYFTQERAKRVVDHLYRALLDGGWLIVSPVEAVYVAGSEFVPVQVAGTTFFRKDLRHSHTTFSLAPTIPVAMTPIAPPPIMETAATQATADIGRPDPEENETPIQSSEDPQQTTTYDEALALYDQGQYAGAVEKLLGECDSSQVTFKAGTSEQRGLTLLARAYANQGQLDAARRWCEEAIAKDTLNPGLYYLLATILLEQGDVTEGRMSLTRTIYLDQDFVLAHFALGNIARQQKQDKAAHKHFNNALTLLQRYPKEKILPESEGITAGRLAEVVDAMMQR